MIFAVLPVKDPAHAKNRLGAVLSPAERASLARSMYQHNDHRAALKRQINLLLGSKLIEEKAYPAYT